MASKKEIKVSKPFNKMLVDGFIKYDERVKVILLTKALKYQSQDNPNQEKTAVSLLKETRTSC